MTLPYNARDWLRRNIAIGVKIPAIHENCDAWVAVFSLERSWKRDYGLIDKSSKYCVRHAELEIRYRESVKEDHLTEEMFIVNELYYLPDLDMVEKQLLEWLEDLNELKPLYFVEYRPW